MANKDGKKIEIVLTIASKTFKTSACISIFLYISFSSSLYSFPSSSVVVGATSAEKSFSVVSDVIWATFNLKYKKVKGCKRERERGRERERERERVRERERERETDIESER